MSHLIVSLFFPVQQKPALQMAPSPTPPPHILYNPTQHMLTYSSFCPSGQTLPSYPNYPIPMQVRTKTQPGNLYTSGMHSLVHIMAIMSSHRPIKCRVRELSCLSSHLAAQRQLSALCDLSTCSWSRTCVQPLPDWGQPEPAASSGRHPAAASGSHPGSRRVHADA